MLSCVAQLGINFIYNCSRYCSGCVITAVCGMPAIVKLWEGELSDHVQQAANLLTSGSVVALPTDTLYGLAALAQHPAAVQDIYRVKKRNPAKPLAVCVAQIDDIFKWAHVTIPRELLQDLLPGPVTLIFQRSNALNKALNPDTGLVGIRIPDSEFIRRVTSVCGGPLALTSANISNQPSPLAISEFRELWSEIGSVFDGGNITDFHKDRCGKHFLNSEFSCHRIFNDSTYSWNFTENAMSNLASLVREGSTVVNLSESGCYKVQRHGVALESTIYHLEKYGLKCSM